MIINLLWVANQYGKLEVEVLITLVINALVLNTLTNKEYKSRVRYILVYFDNS